MSQVCELINKRFSSPDLYAETAALFSPFHKNLCTSVSQWPYAAQREFVSEYASKIARGNRVAAYLRYARDKFIVLLPRNENLLNLLIIRAELGLTERQSTIILKLAGYRGCVGFERVSTRPFIFPQDHAWHYPIQTEYWWFAANMFSTDRYKLPLTLVMSITRRSIVPPMFWGAEGGEQNSVFTFNYILTIPEKNFTVTNAFEVDGAWQVSSAEIVPFFIGAGDSFQLRSIRSDGVFFPLYVRCRDKTKSVDIELQVMSLSDSLKYMRSTTSPGIGVRFYDWPRVEITTGVVRVPNIDISLYSGSGILIHSLGSREDCGPQLSIAQKSYKTITNSVTLEAENSMLWTILHLHTKEDITIGIAAASLLQANIGIPFKFMQGLYTRPDGTFEMMRGTIIFTQIFTSPITNTKYPFAMRIDIPTLYMSFTLTPTVQKPQVKLDVMDIESYSGGCIVTGSQEGTALINCRGFVAARTQVVLNLEELDFIPTTELINAVLQAKRHDKIFTSICILLIIPITLLAILTVCTKLLLTTLVA